MAIKMLNDLYEKTLGKVGFIEKYRCKSFLPLLGTNFKAFGYEVKPEASDVGRKIMKSLKEGAPWLSEASVLKIAKGLLVSGKEEPIHLQVPKGQALYKVLPMGEKLSDFDSYFMMHGTFEEIMEDCISFIDALALTYQEPKDGFDFYETAALVDGADIFVSSAAPMSNGDVARCGGYFRAIITNRSQWSKPELTASLSREKKLD